MARRFPRFTKVIERFSEDIDLTYDIRALVPDLLREGNPIPASTSQEKKITRAVHARLPDWIEQTVRPVIDDTLAANGLLLSDQPEFDAILKNLRRHTGQGQSAGVRSGTSKPNPRALLLPQGGGSTA